MELSWIWIGIIVLAVVFEATTDNLYSIWFVPAGVIAVLLDFLNVQPVWQIIVFLVISLVGIFAFRRLLAEKMKNTVTKTNIEAIIGEKCVVTEKIDNFAGCGQAKVHGQVWSARGCNDDDVFEEGEVLKIVAIEGVKLICKRF